MGFLRNVAVELHGVDVLMLWYSGREGNCIFTRVSYAEARNRYRLDVCLPVRLSVRHTLALYQNG